MDAGEARDDMLESLSELQSMVSETLNFIRDASAQENTRSCNVSQLINELSQRYQQRGQVVDWQGCGDIVIHCRPLAIKRVLSNLIENALTYAGEVSITLQNQSDMIRIDVLDNGPGIAESMLEQAFEPFVRLNSSQTATVGFGGGLGLGLSIARACVHAHGGELILKNRSPAGLCATILLPKGVRS